MEGKCRPDAAVAARRRARAALLRAQAVPRCLPALTARAVRGADPNTTRLRAAVCAATHAPDADLRRPKRSAQAAI